jgi:hypothetical protein
VGIRGNEDEGGILSETGNEGGNGYYFKWWNKK